MGTTIPDPSWLKVPACSKAFNGIPQFKSSEMKSSADENYIDWKLKIWKRIIRLFIKNTMMHQTYWFYLGKYYLGNMLMFVP